MFRLSDQSPVRRALAPSPSAPAVAVHLDVSGHWHRSTPQSAEASRPSPTGDTRASLLVKRASGAA